MSAPLTGPATYDKAVQRAIAYVHDLLPATGLHRAWRNHELRDPVDGRRHALPLMVLTVSGLWVIDIHTEHGELLAQDEVWRWVRTGSEAAIPSPLPAAAHKAGRIRERLQMRGLGAIPVHPLVLLAPGANAGAVLRSPARLWRDDLAHGPTPIEGTQGIDALLSRAPAPGRGVTVSMADRLADVLPAIGVQPLDFREVAGGWRLDTLLADHDIWQEHAAVAILDDDERTARVRTWVVPGTADPDTQVALRRAALRESEVLGRLGRHPYILGLLDTVEHAGVCRLVFEGFSGGLPLHLFLKAHPDLSFDHRLAILAQIAQALDHCHRQEVVHRCLSPDAVLVRLGSDGPEVRLHHFESAVARHADATTVGTRHLSRFAARLTDLYRAPEIERDPDVAGVRSDLFSLGCLAWLLFSGRHPGPMNERDRMLRDSDALWLWEVCDDLDDDLVDLVASATRAQVEQRPVNVRVWIGDVLALYRPEGDPEADPIDPLRAGPGDSLGRDIVVEAVLGTGASARVLAVLAGGESRALKVPLDPAAQTLLLAEHALLKRVQHPNVVRVDDDLVELFGRRCLLMQHAGAETLADRIRREGTLPLDYVHRLGDELLGVLEHLHGEGFTHRDIKPSNLAFASQANQAHRLLLFDFSLAALPPESVRAGTPRWRDPLLGQRGSWDPEADLYAATAILHFALTGERPRWNERAQAVDVVSARFDPDLRGALSTFFQHAFASNMAARYPDAEASRRAWNDLFASDHTSVPDHLEPDIVPERLVRARLDSPIGALGLSSRALNALERAGVVDVRDLLGLPRNRLSLVRGVGSQIRDEIARAIDLLRPRLSVRDDAAIDAFVDASNLPQVDLADVDLGLDAAAVDALRDAAIRTLADLAQAGTARVSRLLQPHGADAQALRTALLRHVPDTPVTGPLGDWLAVLLRPHGPFRAGKVPSLPCNPSPPSRRTRWEVRLGVLIGLDPLPGPDGGPGQDTAPPGGRTNGQVAAALGDTPVKFRASFQKARVHWDKNAPQGDAAVAAVGAALDSMGPVSTIPDVGLALLRNLAPALLDDPGARLQATALVRWGTEVRVPDPPFQWRRIGRHAWLARSPVDLDTLQVLGRLADGLAAADHPTPLESADRTLRPAAGALLGGLSPEDLVARAVAASESAALSPRLEVYPRGLPAARAVELSGAVLGANVTPDDVIRRVSARYPDAEPLPGRPRLDGLLGAIGLRWSTDKDAYVRPGAPGSTLTATELWKSSAASMTTARPSDPTEHRVARFTTALRHSLESGHFRAIQVSARQSEAACRALRGTVPNLLVTDIDAWIWHGLLDHIKTQEADRDFVLGVDRDGPAGPHWGTFVDQFVAPVVQALADEVVGDRTRPRLLVHPGLLARYGLAPVLDRLVHAAENEPGAPIWMLLPAWDDGASPVVRHPLGDLPVPVYLPAQKLRAPRAWIASVCLPLHP